MGKSGKPGKQVIIDSIVSCLKKGEGRATVLGKMGKKWGISRTTFDRLWKTGQEQYKEVQDLAKAEADSAYIQTAGILAVEALMSQAEAQRITTDIARGDLADYMIIKKVEHTPRVEIGLKEYIRVVEDEIKFEDEFADMAGYSEDELQGHVHRQESRRRDVVRLKLELKRNPHATKIIDGPTEWREVAELDLVKIMVDKKKGKIKSFAHTQFGVKVEMYSADAALVNVLKMRGAFKEDNEQSKPEIITPIIQIQVMNPIEE